MSAPRCIVRPDGSRYWLHESGQLTTTISEIAKTEGFKRDLRALERIRALARSNATGPGASGATPRQDDKS